MSLKKHITPTNLLLEYIKEEPWAYIRVVFLTCVIGVLEFVGISSILPAVSVMLGSTPEGIPDFIRELFVSLSPVLIFGGYLFLVLFQGGLVLLAYGLFIKDMARWRTDLSIKYIQNIIGADFKHYDKLKPGEVEVIISRNIGFAVKIRFRTATFVSDALLAVFYVLIALYVSSLSFILFAGVGLMYFVLDKFTIHLRIKHMELAKQRYYRAAGYIAEYFSDMRSLVMSKVSRFLDIVRGELHAASHSQMRTDQINIFLNNIHQPVMLFMIGVGVMAAKFFFQIPNAELLVVIYVFYRAAPKVIAVARGYGEIIGDSPVDITPDIQRWQSFAKSSGGKVAGEPGKVEIKFENVVASYAMEKVLRGVSFEIPEGSLTALVGKSGSGKSTIFDIICGFKEIDQGIVFMGGLDISRYLLDPWRQKNIAILRPESVLVSGSIAENVAFLDEHVDKKRIEDLIQLVGLSDLMNMRDGVDSLIDPRGNNFSAGQKQRILLARALYKQPRLLLLDEPTSNLDKKTEEDISELICSLKKGKMTILVVSHRERILSDADQILHLADGKISSQPSPRVVLESEGLISEVVP